PPPAQGSEAPPTPAGSYPPAPGSSAASLSPYSITPPLLYSSLFPEAPPGGIIGQATMRVATYNICGSRARRHPGHIERVAEVIRSLRADVVGLQEVYDGSPRSPYGDQPRQLEELTGMRCIFW